LFIYSFIHTHDRSLLVVFAFSDVPDSYYYRTAKVGQTVKFPCPTKLPEDVAWAHMSKLHSSQTYFYLGSLRPSDPRFTVLDKNHSYSLVIYNVTVNDSAFFECIDDSGFGRHHYYGLTVKGICVFFHGAVSKQNV